MNRILAIIITFGLLPFVGAARQAQATAAFQSTTHDFGTVTGGGAPVSHFFEIENTGDSPLVIISAVPSCDCVSAIYTADPIAPGEKSVIKVTYSPEARPGPFRRLVRITTNSAKNPKATLTVSGRVE